MGGSAAGRQAGGASFFFLLAYQELQAAHEAHEVIPAFHALQQVPGVVFLERGVTLARELREKLGRSWWPTRLQAQFDLRPSLPGLFPTVAVSAP
ncbi:MAG TPA: hypothetical protein DCE44_10525 [Verrucomicrobiales bacterium]|nr:hypothetical protein [Verrucomicrobiales bacterium]